MPDFSIQRRPKLRKRINELKFATWNVRTLLRPGALEELKEEAIKYNIDLIALQEVRWPTSGFIEQRSHSLFHTEAKGGVFGNGFLISKKLRNQIIDFKPVSETICKLRLRAKFYNISIVNVHAPTEGKDESIKAAFYNKLEKIIDELPKYDMKIILGDFNAKIGKEKIYQPTIGKHSLHEESNENGKFLIELATIHNLKISSTYFPHKSIHKHTWKSPDSLTMNQIDHVLVTSRHVKNILDIKSCRGANMDSDHYMVRIKIACRISLKNQRTKGKVSEKWQLSDLKNKKTLSDYQEQLQKYLQTKPHNEVDVENMWQNVKDSIISAAEIVVNKQTTSNKKKWFDDECKLAVAKKNTARIKLLQRNTRSTANDYNNLKKAAYKLCRKKKRQYFKDKLEVMEEAQQRRDVKNFYSGIQANKKVHARQKSSLVRNKDGHLVTGSDIVDVWANHFKNLLNPTSLIDHQQQNESIHMLQRTDELESPTIDEVAEAIQKLNNNKASGIDNIPAEFIKSGNPPLLQRIHLLIAKIWESEQLPEDWKTVTLVPVYKKGDPWCCNNYRGISLLCITYKVLATILYKKLMPLVESSLGDYQCGFRRNRSTIDQIFTIRQILEKNWEYARRTFCLFIDFKTAYDSVVREEVWKYMKELNIPSKLVNLVKMTTSDLKYLVKIGNMESDTFETSAGLKQGDAIAPLLFNIVLEMILRKANINIERNIIRNTSQILAYADDIAILTRDLEEMRTIFSNIEQVALKAGLQINEKKTKIMVVDRRTPYTNESVEIQSHIFEVVQDFVYLGSLINPQNNCSMEIQRRINLGNRCVAALYDLLKSRILSKASKTKIYKTLILPVVIYGSETWTLSRIDEEKLLVFERRVLRRIFGPVRDGDSWRSRMNYELQQVYGSPSIMGIIKSRIISWFGHLMRMPNERFPHQVYHKTPAERRPSGRPKLRWIDKVKQNIQSLGLEQTWRRAVHDRRKWRQHVETAKIHFGL